MNTTRTSLITKRNVGAIFAGLLATVIPPTIVDALLRAIGVFPAANMPNELFLLAIAYRTIFTIAGAYLAARIASGRPMGVALVLGVIGMIAGAIGIMATWNRPEFGPLWYPFTLVVLAIPCTSAGAKLEARARQQDTSNGVHRVAANLV